LLVWELAGGDGLAGWLAGGTGDRLVGWIV